jgi:hypothetical protein
MHWRRWSELRHSERVMVIACITGIIAIIRHG